MEYQVYNTVVIELRPKLQSANVFITLVDDISSSKVNLNENNFQIFVNDTRSFSIPFSNFRAAPHTLSSLKISKKSISFRFFTVNVDVLNGLSYKTEILQKSNPPQTKSKEIELLKNDVGYILECSNCKKSLVNENLKFQRVLPLPDNSDSSDWFCHGHSSNNSEFFGMEPEKQDLFYTHCYFHVNKENITHVRVKNDVVVCRFCLNWLGQLYRQTTYKLWTNTIHFVSGSLIITTRALTDVFQTIKYIFSTCLFNSVKTILQYRTSTGEKNYLLLWILEKQLRVVFNTSRGAKNLDVAKTLFKFTDSDNNKLFRQWRCEQNVEVVDISKPMMIEVLKHLHKNNRVFPLEFSKSNEYLVSYLLMFE